MSRRRPCQSSELMLPGRTRRTLRERAFEPRTVELWPGLTVVLHFNSLEQAYSASWAGCGYRNYSAMSVLDEIMRDFDSTMGADAA